ncbi:hypothetical protein CAJCM15448_49810 [Candidozyma auris]|nr:hypothetical protein CAJCM15448_49810 [[Candida] auris]
MALENDLDIISEAVEHSLHVSKHNKRADNTFDSLEHVVEESKREFRADRKNFMKKAMNALVTIFDLRMQLFGCITKAIAWTLTRNATILGNRTHFTNA